MRFRLGPGLVNGLALLIVIIAFVFSWNPARHRAENQARQAAEQRSAAAQEAWGKASVAHIQERLIESPYRWGASDTVAVRLLYFDTGGAHELKVWVNDGPAVAEGADVLFWMYQEKAPKTYSYVAPQNVYLAAIDGPQDDTPWRQAETVAYVGTMTTFVEIGRLWLTTWQGLLGVVSFILIYGLALRFGYRAHRAGKQPDRSSHELLV